MKYCKKCLTTDLRPNASFDEHGVCIACRYSGSKSFKSSKVKLDELIKRIINTRSKTRRSSHFDCIVVVSGGKIVLVKLIGSETGLVLGLYSLCRISPFADERYWG